MENQKLRVVIVGAGFAGLCTAIECQLRGIQAVLVEKYPTSRNYGDVIDFFPNGGRIMQKWDNGRIAKELLAVCINQGDKFEIYRHDGLFLTEEPWNARPEYYHQQFAGHRGQIHELVLNYAVELGVEKVFGVSVIEYLESEGMQGVVLDNGERILGDVVVAADGPRSIARQQVLNLPDVKTNSGYAIFRAHFYLDEDQKKNPLLRQISDEGRDYTRMWVAHDMHGLIYVWNKGTDVGWAFTHKDDQDIGESWSFPGNKDDVFKCLKEGGLEELWWEVVRNTPPEQLVDYKLVWREPLTTWLSAGGRTVVIGDAAHCHLPSSGQGACQSMEDGVTLAVCLDRAKGDVPLALKVFERIRFNRSHAIHMSSVSNRDDYHTVAWTKEFVDANPGCLQIARPEWVTEFDAEVTAESHFDRLADDVRSGKPGTIEELSLPAGGTFVVAKEMKDDQGELEHLPVGMHGNSVVVVS